MHIDAISGHVVWNVEIESYIGSYDIHPQQYLRDLFLNDEKTLVVASYDNSHGNLTITALDTG